MAAYTSVEPVPEHGLLRLGSPATSASRAAGYDHSNSPLRGHYCADCHGPGMDGGMASSLIDSRWDYGASDAAIFASIAVGIPEDGHARVWRGDGRSPNRRISTPDADGRARTIPLMPPHRFSPISPSLWIQGAGIYGIAIY